MKAPRNSSTVLQRTTIKKCDAPLFSIDCKKSPLAHGQRGGFAETGVSNLFGAGLLVLTIAKGTS
jgi:hypothetical protein